MKNKSEMYHHFAVIWLFLVVVLGCLSTSVKIEFLFFVIFSAMCAVDFELTSRKIKKMIKEKKHVESEED